jgi:hypothetical protein
VCGGCVLKAGCFGRRMCPLSRRRDRRGGPTRGMPAGHAWRSRLCSRPSAPSARASVHLSLLLPLPALRYSLEDELRVLLVHGCLHLAGFDHERGGADLDDMAAAEAEIMANLGWKGQGLIEAATSAAGSDDEDEGEEKRGGGRGGDAMANSSSLSSSDDDGRSRGGGDSVDSATSGGRAASGAQASTTGTWSGDSVITRTGR